MKICMERFEHLGGVQYVERDGAKFYDLAGVMDTLGVKPSWKNGIEKAPVAISGEIATGAAYARRELHRIGVSRGTCDEGTCQQIFVVMNEGREWE